MCVDASERGGGRGGRRGKAGTRTDRLGGLLQGESPDSEADFGGEGEDVDVAVGFRGLEEGRGVVVGL